MGKILTIIVALVVGLLFLEIFSTPLTNVVTTAQTQTTAVVFDASGDGSMTLNSLNWFTDTTRMTVTSALDGAITGDATLGTDRLSLAIADHTVSTTSNVTVVHRSEDTTSDAVPILTIVPFFAVMITLGSALFGTFVGARAAVKKGGGLFGAANLQGFVVLLIGIILIGVVNSFVDNASDEYTIQPDYVGVSAVLPLVMIGYVLTIISLAVGTGVAAFGGGFGR
jgi:hypothetical protein